MTNYNVLLTFLYRAFDGIATGVWSSSVLSNYISVLGGGSDSANEVSESTIQNYLNSTDKEPSLLPNITSTHAEGGHCSGDSGHLPSGSSTARYETLVPLAAFTLGTWAHG